MLIRVATVVQVLQDLFMFYCMFYFTCDRSFTGAVRGRLRGASAGRTVEGQTVDVEVQPPLSMAAKSEVFVHRQNAPVADFVIG